MIRRFNLPEIEDQPWCPKWLRWILTAYLREAIRASRAYHASVPSIAALLDGAPSSRVVDLCSGAGGPWPDLIGKVASKTGGDVTVTLTDLHPQLRMLAPAGDDRIDYDPRPVAADAVPRDLDGTRTMFTALHHFAPAQVEEILEAARRDRVGFAAFEATHRSLKGILVTLLIPVMVLVLIPRVRPLRWYSFVFTYLVPIVPLAIWWDGLASTLRTYRAAEVEALVKRSTGYEWTISEDRIGQGPLPMLQVIGRPLRS